MPIVQVHLLEGRSSEQKKKLVAEMTASICSALGVKPEQVRIILSEMARGDFAVGGVLSSEKNH
ncbi:MAG: 2-hydroxymuconate tautomerase [Synergistetes bacterium ADurb.Bin155]|jgi:4-oxalocrotonate tautomerase|nr:2-hydroxymuconate tautomerase family protein [Synergistales bacterium]NMD17600.1 2-hydroxymuconate tautomerase family protein [Synergistaceae bacterium]OQB45078.1 MAG: 2-hydroxymuconate tautomerase [Synergistetes bacterium ADurb.Bin155]MBP8996343.1 2-hydroxymuconate tautomerase family protein [Synergistales bacterium]HOC81910.1 2-hydroxymuconate tautomerase [Synergistales bacterium]